MNLLYNIGISAFSLGIKIAATYRPKVRKLKRGQRASLAFLRENAKDAGEYIWVHAASLGEFEQGRPLIEMIKRDNPESKILLTFFSPSGYEVRKNYTGADLVCYLPLDTPHNTRRFLDFVKPKMAIFVKYEFWGNYLTALKKRGIPTYIISSIFRPSQPFFKPWGFMFRNMLKCFTTIFVQDTNSEELLAGIGVKNVVVAGDTRFDRVTDILAGCKKVEALEEFKASAEKDGQKVVMMGSSWDPDESLVIPYFNEHPEMRLVIAPHEFDEVRLHAIEASITRPVKFYTQLENPADAADAQCLIIDCFGILSSSYRYADIAYVGGGFGVSIHNINEAAVYGIPVLFGPNNHKFREAQGLKQCGGGIEVTNQETVNEALDHLLSDAAYLKQCGDAAGDYIKANLGATKTIYKALFGNK